jgi:MerR family mercuric resistance operon transcriptional regulator
MRALKIGTLAELAGVNLETIRYYERIGLLPPPGRTEGGHRAYEASHVRRLSFIHRARELGFAIAEIRNLLALAEPQRRSCAEVREIAGVHLLEVRTKLADLARLEAILSDTIAQCSGEKVPACPVLDMLGNPGP